MGDHPIDPAELLDVAELPLHESSGEADPPNSAHRRAVSTEYCAVFHAITATVAATVFPTAGESFRQSIRRWIAHGDVRTVARWVSRVEGADAGRPPAHITALLAPPGQAPIIDATAGLIAAGFITLNEARDQADYDHAAVFTHGSTVDLVVRARDLVDKVTRASGPGADAFFGLIAMQARVQSR